MLSELHAQHPYCSAALTKAACVCCFSCRSFVTLDSEFGVLSEGSYVGSTAVVVLLSSMRLWVAHAGEPGMAVTAFSD